MPELIVTSITDVAAGIREYELADADGQPLGPWTPGAHIDVHLPIHEARPINEIRHYSLCSDPEDLGSYRIAVLRVEPPLGRGGSCWIHDNVKVGDQLGTSEPRNAFHLPEAERYLLLAGGVGITPIASMVRELHRRRADWQLVYGARTREHMAYADELLELAPERVQLIPQDQLGIVPLNDVLAYDPGLTVLCCGPTPMMDATAELCAGWPDGSLHMERFSAAPVEGGQAFEVELAQSGLTLTIGPDTSILEAMFDAGLNPDCSCEQGICGTCETAVIAGEVDHRDDLLTEAERATNSTMMICVSRARGARLVLDC